MKQRKIRSQLALIAFVAWLPLVAVMAEERTQRPTQLPKMSVRVNTVGYWQALNHNIGDGSFNGLMSGFQSAAGNISFDGEMAPGLDLHFEVYLSSRHHEGQVTPREGYLMVTAPPAGLNFRPVQRLFDFISVKAGHFEIDFGNQHLRRSDNAQVQQNPLVGNYVVDPNVVYVGAEVFSKPQRLNWLLGLTNGQTTGDLQEGRGYAMHGKLWGDVSSSFSVAGSYYRVDQSQTPTGYPLGGSFSNLFAGNRSGGRYAGVLRGGGEPGQILPGNGQDITAWQLDAAFEARTLSVRGHYGGVGDADINGTNPADEATFDSPGERWSYYGIEAVYNFNPSFYGAARYSGATAELLNGTAASGAVERYQVGFGFWINNGILLKVEYVDQTYRDFDPEAVVDRLAVGKQPRLYGLITEVSMAL